MADKFWDFLKLKNGDHVHFIPPAPDGENLGGVTKEEREQITKLGSDLADKLTQPASAQIGQYFRVAALDENGHAVLEAVDLPIASPSKLGVIRTNETWGTRLGNANTGELCLAKATDAELAAKSNQWKPVVPSNLDYAVRAGLLSNSQITDADYPAIHKTLGIGGEFELIESITVSDSTPAIISKTVEPDGTPYNFKKLMVAITMAENSPSGNLRIETHDSWGANVGAYTNSATYITYIADATNGRICASWVRNSGVSSGGSIQTTPRDMEGVAVGAIPMLKVYHAANGSIKMPNGTKINIYGVRV